MTQRAHHIRLYKRLGLSDEATIADLKQQFHLLANKHHPDKLIHQEDSSQKAEAFTTIQSAYQELRKFYSQHGYLPLENIDNGPPPLNPIVRKTPYISRSKISITSILTSIMLIILFALFIVPEKKKGSMPDEYSPYQNKGETSSILPADKKNTPITKYPANNSNEKINAHPITLGMTMGKVFELIGVPDDAVGDNWYYGASEIYFRDGRVSGWLNDSSSPIKTDSDQPLVLVPTSERF